MFLVKCHILRLGIRINLGSNYIFIKKEQTYPTKKNKNKICHLIVRVRILLPLSLGDCLPAVVENVF
jgi:hypothetical protein